MLRAENVTPTTVGRFAADGVAYDKPLHFFLERYDAAYKREMAHFCEAVAAKQTPSVGAHDGRQALVLAEAALASFKSGQPVSVA